MLQTLIQSLNSAGLQLVTPIFDGAIVTPSPPGTTLSDADLKSVSDNIYNTHGMVIKRSKRPPDADTTEFIYYEAVKGFRGISEDIAHYVCLEEGGDGDRIYDFL